MVVVVVVVLVLLLVVLRGCGGAAVVARLLDEVASHASRVNPNPSTPGVNIFLVPGSK